MNVLVGAVPGLIAVLAVVLFARGYHLLRSDPAEQLSTDDIVLLTGPERERAEGQSFLSRLADGLAIRLRPALPDRVIGVLQRQIDLAGRPDGMSVNSLIAGAARWLIIVSPAVVLFLVQGNFVFVLLCAVAVVVLPLAKLSGRARQRSEQIDRDLPDFLDVLAVTVSAGLGFRSALATVATRFGGPLAEEIQHALNQMANGASLRSAFLDLRARTGSEAMDEFITAYLQSEELGAPMVDTLNEIAGEIRRADAQRLRQKAAKAEPRVTLIVTVVMVPGCIILIGTGMFVAFGVDQLGSVLGG